MMPKTILFVVGALSFQLAAMHAMDAEYALSNNELTDKLWEAARDGDVATLQELIKQGADLSGITSDKRCDTALHIAVRCNHPQAVTVLLKAGARSDCENESDRSPIEMWAFFCPSVKEEKMLAARALLTTVSRKELASTIADCKGKRIKETLIAQKLEIAKKYLPNVLEDELRTEIDQSIVEAIMQSFQPKK